MEKQLKNYLHLYLGCECQTPLGIMVLTKISTHGIPVWFHYIMTKDFKGIPSSNFKTLCKENCIGRGFFYREVKPILRHLSDITDEELKCIRSERGHLKGVHRDDLRFVINQNNWSPGDFIYLLSKHFDLFELIESNLALCAPTMEDVRK